MISSVVDGVFIHVRDLRQAAEWYAALLGKPVKADELERGYYTLNDPDQRPWITLDAHQNDESFQFAPAPHPVLSLATDDLKRARARLVQLGARRVGPVRQPHPGLSCVTFHDPDGNALMLIERRLGAAAPAPSAEKPAPSPELEPEPVGPDEGPEPDSSAPWD
ncbi:VOC family protein [Caulobacter sp. 17J80-11]|uniref:VOC family protein n=1 Tax=Caulobacter sp. 17J80-11 TaxID=2763502 RepID=UPI001653AAFB|nr:VOC family protein [Caulobacter sp. 17J80-11]MBC6981663.1 VOC family protein [Caulobacter sp. 17J80-11]